MDQARIKARALNGNVACLRKLAWLPVEDSLPILERLVAFPQPDRPELRSIAYKIMARREVEAIYERRIKEQAEIRSEGPDILLERLGEFKTRGAVRIIGSYLYVDARPLPSDEDVARGPAYSWSAAAALGSQGFADTPTAKNPVFYDESDIRLWRQWWDRNGYKFN